MEVDGPDDASIIVCSPIGCTSPEGDGTPTPAVVPFAVVCDASPPPRPPNKDGTNEPSLKPKGKC